MSIEPIITVNSVSKTYRLYHSHRDRMKEWVHPLRKRYHKKYHALKDVSFTVGKGEVLGVIGQNGSGKSTLLKILSSVVTPTSGSFKCNGRISALLELGGGFNMDLTGIENVYFLGAIQGYTKKEMSGRLQQILDFAEIGEYANQPVKNYSSGMYVRLAFSININIDPEILIVDEALSVGDIRFQQKCFRKIREIKDSGKTIVLCSHSLSAVKDFCSRAIWIHHGEIKSEGDPHMVTEKYQTFMSLNGTVLPEDLLKESLATTTELPEDLLDPKYGHLHWNDMSRYQNSGSGDTLISFATMIDLSTQRSLITIKDGELIRVVCVVVTQHAFHHPGFQIVLNGQFSSEVFKIINYHYNQALVFEANTPTLVAVDFKFPDLGNGNYSLSLAVTDIIDGLLTYKFQVHDAMMITVENPDVRFTTGAQMVLKDARIVNLDPSKILHI